MCRSIRCPISGEIYPFEFVWYLLNLTRNAENKTNMAAYAEPSDLSLYARIRVWHVNSELRDFYCGLIHCGLPMHAALKQDNMADAK